MEDKTKLNHIQLLDAHIMELKEHFDCVQILVSTPDPKGSQGTLSHYRGYGNWFARQGMGHDFINQDKARTFASEIKQSTKES